MVFSRIKLAFGAIAATSVALVPATAAQAFTTDGSWNYVRDSFNDSTFVDDSDAFSYANIQVGGTLFELYGLAIKQDGDKISVAFNTNLGLNGHSTKYAADGNISWGDLIFDFGGTQYGVRFTDTNDSKVGALGLYENVTTADVTQENAGWPTIADYEKKVGSEPQDAPIYGDLGAGTTELGARTTKGVMPVVMGSGTKVANDNFNLLDAESLGDLDFVAGLGSESLGSQTIAFSFTRSAAMVGDFTATLFAECFNDGVVLKGEFAPSHEVPEASNLATLALIAGAGTIAARKRRQKYAS
jgi:hypothetical protein